MKNEAISIWNNVSFANCICLTIKHERMMYRSNDFDRKMHQNMNLLRTKRVLESYHIFWHMRKAFEVKVVYNKILSKVC